jgi:hypothetical protein
VVGDAEAQACRDMGRSRPYAARVHVLLDVALHNVVPARHPRVSIATPGPLVHRETACCAGAGKRGGTGDAVARTCVLLSAVRPWRTGASAGPAGPFANGFVGIFSLPLCSPLPRCRSVVSDSTARFIAAYLRSVNWYRLAFIFLPAAIRGDIMYLSFFLPFLFGPILQRVVRTFVTLYDKTDNIKVDFCLPSTASAHIHARK